MILVDTSIWIDHLARSDSILALMIAENRIVQHPFVTGEILVGNPHQRERLQGFLRDLPSIDPVDEGQFHDVLDRAELWGRGLGFVDVHLIAAALIAGDTRIWTRDRRMLDEIVRLDLAHRL
jgi:predicted nucleic acid-binding protein